MEQTKIIGELVKRYKKIGWFLTKTRSGHRPKVSSIFPTAIGKHLGSSIDQIQEFSLKGVLLIFPFQKFFRAIQELYANPEYIDTIRSAGATDSDIQLINYIRDEILQEIGIDSQTQIFNEKEERIFLGSLTTSLYAFVDGYSSSALKEVVKIDGAATRILRSLSDNVSFSLGEIERILSNPVDGLREKALSESNNKSVKQRFQLIVDGLGMNEEIKEAVRIAQLPDYEHYFKDFSELRHRVAHRFPIPKIQKFLDNALIRSNVNELRAKYRESMKGMKIPPDFLLKTFDVLMDWMDNRQTQIGIILQLSSMVSLYPAVIDNAFDLVKKKDSPDNLSV